MPAFADITVDDLSVKHGYRPYREDGMRVEQDENGIIHNYGHGGSGVSMSWWSAIQSINYIDTLSESVLKSIASQIARTNVITEKTTVTQ